MAKNQERSSDRLRSRESTLKYQNSPSMTFLLPLLLTFLLLCLSSRSTNHRRGTSFWSALPIQRELNMHCSILLLSCFLDASLLTNPHFK
jgi:hypothetical protein